MQHIRVLGSDRIAPCGCLSSVTCVAKRTIPPQSPFDFYFQIFVPQIFTLTVIQEETYQIIIKIRTSLSKVITLLQSAPTPHDTNGFKRPPRILKGLYCIRNCTYTSLTSACSLDRWSSCTARKAMQPYDNGMFQHLRRVRPRATASQGPLPMVISRD